MTDDELFVSVERHLSEHRSKVAERERFRAAVAPGELHAELWAALRPIIRTRAEHRHAARFIEAMLREWSRQ